MFDFAKITIDKILGFFATMHSENESNVSWLRVCGSFIIASIILVYLSFNAVALYKGLPPVDFQIQSVAVVFGVLGAKVMHKSKEASGPLTNVLEDLSLDKDDPKKKRTDKDDTDDKDDSEDKDVEIDINALPVKLPLPKKPS